FFFSSRRRHTRSYGDWSSDVCSSDLFYFSRLRCRAFRPKPLNTCKRVLKLTSKDALTWQSPNFARPRKQLQIFPRLFSTLERFMRRPETTPPRSLRSSAHWS